MLIFKKDKVEKEKDKEKETNWNKNKSFSFIEKNREECKEYNNFSVRVFIFYK